MEAFGSLLGTLVASGRIVDPILLLVVAEAVLVVLRPALFGPRAPLLAGLAAGAGLLLALRAGLSGAPWPWIAGALALAGGAHLTELALRRARTLDTKTLRRREPSATSADAAALGWVSRKVTRGQAFMARPGQPPLPPPFAGEGGPCVSRGRSGRSPAERGATVQGALGINAEPVPEAWVPSPDPLRGPPSPAEGGGRAGWPAARTA